MDRWLLRNAHTARALAPIAIVALMRCTLAPDSVTLMAASAAPAEHRDQEQAEADAGPQSFSIPDTSELSAPQNSARPTARRSAPRRVRADVEAGSGPNRAAIAADDALREVAEDTTDDPLSGLEDLR